MKTSWNLETDVATPQALHVLGTEPDLRFDQLTKLAQRLIKAPISSLSIVDKDKEWFKSCQGWEPRDTEIKYSFGAAAIKHEDVFVIQDAVEDPEFFDNPMVIHYPKVRFYAGCPIATKEGANIGVLSVFDLKPRSLTQAELLLLRGLTDVAETEINRTADIGEDVTKVSHGEMLLKVLRQVLLFSKRTRQPMCGLFLRLNNLREINESHGNDIGDRALIKTADIMIHAFRGSDVSSRIGSSKFCVILPQCSEKNLERVILRFEEKVNQHNESGDLPFKLVFDIGSFNYDPTSPEPIEQIIQRTERLVKVIGKPRYVSRL